MELTIEIQIEIIKTKLENYQQQVYSLQLDLKCANILEDEQWKERIRLSSKRLIQIMEVLQAEMAKLKDAISAKIT